ncbi:FHY3/FAR1 family [Trema orientale]|uniref:FHY3/FAR1 family n=1 Tax=Trema orientale TaxID=63057 RepID=A0A2P5EJB9_TREOI|nr:FHY3/FAR1 family [Trema orientale]
MENINSALDEELQSRRKLDFQENDGNCDQSHHLKVIVEDDSKEEATDCGKKNIESLHSKIPSEAIPQVNMEFEKEEDVYEFYNSYAYKVGFSIRRSKGHKDKDGKIKDRTFCCSSEGHREKDKRNVNVKCPRAQTRFGCLAKLKIKSTQMNTYRVVEFIAEHTHQTSTSNKSHLHRSQRRLTLSQAAEIDLADISRIAPKSSWELMYRRAGSCENVGFTLVDFRNHIRTK